MTTARSAVQRGRGQYNRAMHPLSAGIYSADQVRDLDRRAIEQFGVPGYELMTRAGHATLERVTRSVAGRALGSRALRTGQ